MLNPHAGSECSCNPSQSRQSALAAEKEHQLVCTGGADLCCICAVNARGSCVQHHESDCFTACVQGKEGSVQSEGFAVITESLKRSKGHLGKPACGSLFKFERQRVQQLRQRLSCQPYVQVLGALEI